MQKMLTTMNFLRQLQALFNIRRPNPKMNVIRRFCNCRGNGVAEIFACRVQHSRLVNVVAQWLGRRSLAGGLSLIYG